MLVILDGWGHGLKPEVSAIAQAETPFVDSLYKKYPNSELITFGEEVGLPQGQMGNSEVGHLNIGAGRVVYQELARINKAIEDGTLANNSTLINALNYAKQNNKAIHLLGLVSDGGVHSHINHLKALCDIISNFGLTKTFIHAFMDGRDTSPKGGINYLQELEDHIKNQPIQIASIIGRYYAMDRDKRWERIKLAYNLLINGKGESIKNGVEAIQEQYDKDIFDEFLPPMVLTNKSNDPIATIKPDDVVLFYNFRTDRPRQLTEVLSQNDKPEYGMKKIPLHYVTMNRYDESFKNINRLFEKEDIQETLGEIISKANKSQVRIAETEKYPHVTFFFNGGREEPFNLERRIMIPSPKVATYDLQPKMSAFEITEAIIQDIEKNQPDFICLNYANTDMVGHTGDFDAAKKAATIVDQCLKKLIEKGMQFDYDAIVIADHGNSDFMINEDGSPHTAHTTNLVPCFYISNDLKCTKISNGCLADVAPTILELCNIKQPTSMTGQSLLKK